ncbi:MAG: hypothetical protein JW940_25225 [Polyangiaceae bacterium]|nr:hypothetical protein [Polyangiaceae bacterium]
MSPGTRPLEPMEFALRCIASQGAAAYLIYLASPADIASVFGELQDELTTALPEIQAVKSSSARQLLEAVAAHDANVPLLVDASAYDAEAWRLLDRRRSSLQRSGVTAIMTTTDSFDALMRHAPNLMSWFGGDVFAFPGTEVLERRHASLREDRLAALRAWSGLTDAEVLEQARAQTLPRDPEYAEWLVLLGRGDLLNA